MARILVLDDSLLQRETMLIALSSCNHQSKAVSNLFEAQLESEIFHPDIILIELLFFQDNGFQLGKQLLDTGAGKVALLAARYQETDAIWANKLGINRVIIRPISADTLGEIIDTMLDQ